MDVEPEARLHKRQLTKARSCPRLIVRVSAIPQIWLDGPSGLSIRLRKIQYCGPVLPDQEQAIRQRHGIVRHVRSKNRTEISPNSRVTRHVTFAKHPRILAVTLMFQILVSLP